MEKDLYKKNDLPMAGKNEISHLAAGTTIKGDISSISDIRIDGNVEGIVESNGKVIMGETSDMKGNINGESVDFYGNITGDLFVKNVLSLKETARVNGNIHTRKLQVDLGAQFNGSCHMIKPAPVAAEETPVLDKEK